MSELTREALRIAAEEAAVEALRAQVNALRALAPFQDAPRMAANEIPPLTESERAVAEHYGVATPRAGDMEAYLRGRERHWYDAAERAENRCQNLLAEIKELCDGRDQAVYVIDTLRKEAEDLSAKVDRHKNEIHALRSEVAWIRSERDSFAQTFKAAADTITALRSEVAALRARLPADPPSRLAAADAAVGRAIGVTFSSTRFNVVSARCPDPSFCFEDIADSRGWRR